jgi:DNA-binding response OmpR family regulator
MKDGKYVILCVDDDADLLESLRLVLEGSGYLMESARSAEEGLRRYREVQPDLVLVDLMMEEIDSGANLVKELRALGKTPPVYMLSSVGDGLSSNTDYSALGLAGVLQKPVNPNILKATLKARLK